MVTVYSTGNADYELKAGDECEKLSSLPMIDFKVEPSGSSWVKQRKVTIIYPSIDGNYEASHRIDGESWTRDSDVPIITKVTMGTWNDDKNNLQIIARDDISGINGMYISTTNSKPSENDSGWISVSSDAKETKTFSKALESGTYYIWVKDKAGNISDGKVGKVEETFCPGNICYISASGSDSGYGSRKKTFATLQKAFDTVENNGQVVLLSNIHLSNQLQSLTGAKTVTLTSDGNNKYIIYRNDTYEWAMIYQANKNSKLIINNLIIDGNNKNAKNAMLALTGETIIQNCILRNARNLNNYGGAINRDPSSNVTLRNVEILNNYTTAGGGAIWGA